MGFRRCWAVAALGLGTIACSAPRTQVHTFLPTAIPAEAQVAGGSCWTHSIAAPARSDAWRCSIGSRIEDPCFEVAGNLDLLCGANPAAPAQARPIALSLTLPLPHEALPTQAAARPWLIELADGALCRPFTGTRPFTASHDVGTYACSHDRIMAGDIGRGRDGRWTAVTGTLTPLGSGLPQLSKRRHVAIRAVWR